MSPCLVLPVVLHLAFSYSPQSFHLRTQSFIACLTPSPRRFHRSPATHDSTLCRRSPDSPLNFAVLSEECLAGNRERPQRMASPQEIIATAKRGDFLLAGTGLFSQVIWVADTDVALKIPYEPGEADDVEKRIYERLGDHPYILQSYGEGELIVGKGLVLRYLSAGTVGMNLGLEKFRVERTQWPIQAAEAMRYIHSRGVIHCDVGIHNFLVQDDGSIALADFCGSVLDGSEAIVSTSTRYTRPLSLAEEELNQTEKDNIFALGTVIYEISVGHQLYPEQSNNKIYQLFQKQEFPDTNILPEPIRTVVDKCWRDQYDTAQEIVSDLGETQCPGMH